MQSFLLYSCKIIIEGGLYLLVIYVTKNIDFIKLLIGFFLTNPHLELNVSSSHKMFITIIAVSNLDNISIHIFSSLKQ